MSDYEYRFGGIQRLFGSTGMHRLRAAHVMVVGVGGVGSWVVEALARSGIGGLTLVDLDDVCVSNVNRQLPALDGTVGRPKVEVLADRVRAIQPEIELTAVADFFTADTAGIILSQFENNRGGFVVDAIDAVTNKCHLIAACRRRGLRLITSGAAGGRTDPTQIRVTDLAGATNDRLLSEVRRKLRREFGFPRSEAQFGVAAVYSIESPQLPQPDGTVCAAHEVTGKPGESRRLHCDQGFGSAAFVTGAFGFAAASHVVRELVVQPLEKDKPFSNVQFGPEQVMTSGRA